MEKLKQHSNKKGIQLNEIDKLFPFHFTIDAKMNIISFGPSLPKIIPSLNEGEHQFIDVFQVLKPEITINPTYQDLNNIVSNCVLLKSLNEKKAIFKGQFERRTSPENIVFFGTLWAEGHEEMMNIETNRYLVSFANENPNPIFRINKIDLIIIPG